MVRPREFDEQMALGSAIQLFWEKGYEAASITELTERMGIQRPSLYAAFGGKKELFHTALRKYSQLSLTYLQNKIGHAPTAKDAIRLYLLGIIDGAGGAKPELGCLCVNAMVELGPHDKNSAAITLDYQNALAGFLQQKLEEGIRSGELSNGLNAEAVARALTVSAIGLSVTMKAAPDRSFAESAVAEILTLLG